MRRYTAELPTGSQVMTVNLNTTSQSLVGSLAVSGQGPRVEWISKGKLAQKY